MKLFSHHTVLLGVLGTLVLAASAPASSTVAVDTAQGDVANLARTESGAQIECTSPDGRVELVSASHTSQSPAARLRDDETLSCPLHEGITTLVIKLPTTSLLERLTFVNENAAAAGELKISVSNYHLPAASPKWVEVEGNVPFSRKRLFNLSMLGLEARYVKLSFDVRNGGSLGALGIYGSKASSWADALGEESQQFGLVSKVKPSRSLKRPAGARNADARVAYISSGENSSASRMIDANARTAHAFAINDRRPTAIVELTNAAELRRVVAYYRTRVPGRVDVYLLDDVGKNMTDLNQRKPDASGTDKDGDGEASVEFDPQGAKYIAIRFTPNDSLGESGSYAGGSRGTGAPGAGSLAAGGGASGVGVGAGPGTGPFEIIEIGAYGGPGLGSYGGDQFGALQGPGVGAPNDFGWFGLGNPNEAPDLYGSGYSNIPFANQGGPELSTTRLGTLAIPPVIPTVSP